MPSVLVRAGDAADAWHSHLVGRAGDDLVLAAPTNPSGRPADVHPGDPISLRVSTAAGSQELLATVVFAPAGGDWTVRLQGPTVRAQRRAYVRIPMSALVTLCRGEHRLRVATVDLSEGGFRGVARDPEPLDLGDEVEVAFDLHGITVEARAELVRRQHRHDERWDLAFRFVGLPPRDADRIRAFVFNRQVQARLKGIL